MPKVEDSAGSDPETEEHREAIENVERRRGEGRGRDEPKKVPPEKTPKPDSGKPT